MKIKKKVKMNLHELIQWAWENSIKHKEFTGSRNGIVEFDFRGWVRTDLIEPDEFFEVEVEEEITEDTKIANLVQVYKEDNNTFVSAWTSDTIEEINALTKRNGCSSIAFYMLNDDLSMTLIWRNGEIVG